MALKKKLKLVLIVWLVTQFLPLQVSGSAAGPVDHPADGAILAQVASNPQQTDAGPRQTGNNRLNAMRRLTAYQMVFTTLPLSFAIIHLILFIYFRKSKENLYFAFFLLFYAANIFTDYQASLFGNQMGDMTYLLINRVMLSIQWVFSLRFVYSLFYRKLPRQFWLFGLFFLVGTVFTLVNTTPGDSNIHYRYIVPVIMLCWIEIARVIRKAGRDKKEGASIIALGFFIYFFFSIFDSLIDQGVLSLFEEMENPYAIGTIGFLVTMSFYLARNYSRTHRQLLEQERHVRELEEARTLQLSMLPECPETIPGIDICLHMQTATEVGGDYYDFQLLEDGTFVLTVGDATGHGMSAGIMVASVKSLFRAVGTDPDIPAFFKKCTSTIKQMNMGNLYMALMLMRIKDNKLTISTAGMPPLLIYREAQQKVDKILIKSPPLGGFSGFSYQWEEVRLKPGDIMLAMSDGFPELFNEKDEMFGYERVEDAFASAPRETAIDVVRHLSLEAEKWRKGREQEDDITFVALKIKPNSI